MSAFFERLSYLSAILAVVAAFVFKLIGGSFTIFTAAGISELFRLGGAALGMVATAHEANIVQATNPNILGESVGVQLSILGLFAACIMFMMVAGWFREESKS